MKAAQERPEPAPKLFSPLYWIAMAAGLILVLAGAAVAWLAPGLRPHPGHAHASRALTAPTARGRDARPIPHMP